MRAGPWLGTFGRRRESDQDRTLAPRSVDEDVETLRELGLPVVGGEGRGQATLHFPPLIWNRLRVSAWRQLVPRCIGRALHMDQLHGEPCHGLARSDRESRW